MYSLCCTNALESMINKTRRSLVRFVYVILPIIKTIQTRFLLCIQRTALDFLIHTCMTKDKYMVHPTKYALGLGFVLFSCGLVLINITHILRYHFTSHYNAWRHNDRNGVSNHQPHDCLLNNLFRGRSTKTSKLRVTGLCSGNSPVTGEFPAQKASNVENVSFWWRHHA